MQLRLLLEAASRAVDKYCHRVFYAFSGTRYYAGAGTKLFFGEDDVLSLTTLKTDEDGDGTFENTLTENTDYFLLPLNLFPKTRAELNTQGNYSGFGLGSIRGAQVIGLFGYGDGKSATPWVDSGAILVNFISDPVLEVDYIEPFSMGQTVLLDAEQMYITEVSAGNQLTVTRAVNGTAQADHNAGTIIYIIDYPEEIQEAAIMLAARLWKRKDSAYAQVLSTSELGTFSVFRGLDDDVKMLLSQYVKRRFFA